MKYTIEEIRTLYCNGTFTYDKGKIDKKLPDNHVFSEDLTIRENREMVQKHNQMVKQAVDDWNKNQQELTAKMRSYVREAMVRFSNLSVKQAEIVEQYCWSEYHHCIGDYLMKADIMADLIEEVLEVKE